MTAFSPNMQAMHYKPTFADFCAHANMNSHERKGQRAFSALCELRPDLSAQVRGVHDLDPFYLDSVLPSFYEWVGNNW